MVDDWAIALIRYFVRRYRILLFSTVVPVLLIGCQTHSYDNYSEKRYSDRSVSKVLGFAKRQAVAQGVDVEGRDIQACYSRRLNNWVVKFLGSPEGAKRGGSVWVEEQDQLLMGEYEEYTESSPESIMKLVYDEVATMDLDLTNYEENICFYPGSETWGVLFSKYSDEGFSELRVTIDDGDLGLMVEFCKGALSDDSPPICE
ncbi:hypothetical protein IC757_10985 [Wenzhouxiangella sp. AB-CW3]|uniref:hypothetical protein n=1 Tax=Wenzhouxiangella sp. AB-CW3 TaxID=2771012 RepID=UPI00168A58BA|nr:hypothetical protein [Wenzhouxiangella sp. AB-CW3]QOC21565.1 hypothetical protein IC757_10985 [Wenzhouxiangella sp. AB-CW3]